MIRYKSNNQQKIEMFSTPFEMNLNPNNRWIKLLKSPVLITESEKENFQMNLKNYYLIAV